VQNIEDLKGKTVAIGNIEGGAYYAAMALTEALGLEAGTDVWFNTEEFENGFKALENGKVAATIIVSGAPYTELDAILKNPDLRLLPIEGKAAEQIVAAKRGYQYATIPAGTYKNQAEAVATVGVKTVLICNADLPIEQAKSITAAIFSHTAEIRSSFANEIRIEAAAQDVFIPFHQGAAEYFAAQGLQVSAE
jgi:TRAP transporter TAXI family solute receptor